MRRMKWDRVGERKYKVGVDHGALYPQKNGTYPVGHVWNGLTTVTKSPSGAEDNKVYADNIPYLNIKSVEILALTIECYYYPDAFKECNGETEIAKGVILGQQRRNPFGFAYRTKLGNDTDGEDYGFELNLVYGCSASPSEQSSETINESPNLSPFSYNISTNPVNVSGIGPDGKPYKPTSCITINSTEVPKEKLLALEDILYGTEGTYEKITTSTTGSIPAGTKVYKLVNGVYVPETAADYISGVEYYQATIEPIEGRLPLPDEIMELFAAG